MEQILTQVWQIIVQIVSNLLNPDAWQEVLRQDGVMWAAFIAVTVIVFTETGLFIGFFLPGDSLLVTVGIVAHAADWPIAYLMAMLWVASVCGDSLGYLIGSRSGPWLFRKEKSLLFRKDNLIAAQEFYARHGGKTIVFAKFIPIFRTFAPVAAGMAKMGYRRFLPYTLFGSALWIVSMLLLGYTAHLWADPILTAIFGRKIEVARNIDKVIVVIVLLSVIPIGLKAWKAWRAKRLPAPSPTA